VLPQYHFFGPIPILICIGIVAALLNTLYSGHTFGSTKDSANQKHKQNIKSLAPHQKTKLVKGRNGTRRLPVRQMAQSQQQMRIGQILNKKSFGVRRRSPHTIING
jgi:hypothetical protein